MTHLIDTHVWLWLLDAPERLSRGARALLKTGKQAPYGVASISAWEIARKESLGRLALTVSSREWLDRACTAGGLRMVDLTPAIAWESCHLPDPFHRDPADQIIVATARVLGLTLITRDERILTYPHVRTLEA